MSAKRLLRAVDERMTRGRLRRWFLRNTVLGGGWGDFLDEVQRLSEGAVVLDLGAGEATLRKRIPRARYIALDRGIGHGGWDYSALDVVADVRQIPLGADTVDVIVCKQVLEHVPEPVEMLREAARVLKPRGASLSLCQAAWAS